MPFRHLIQCTDCNWIGNHDSEHEDCPKDPMKDPVKRAEAEAWQAEYDRRTKVWDEWVEKQVPSIEHAYPSVDHDPMEIAVNGQCFLHLPHDEFWGEGKPYTSDVLTNPTWGEVLAFFDEAIKTTNDYHHVFLEGLIFPREPEGEVPTIEFSTGS